MTEKEALNWAADAARAVGKCCIVVTDLGQAERCRAWLIDSHPGCVVKSNGDMMTGEARIVFRSAKANPEYALLGMRGAVIIMPGALGGLKPWRAHKWRDLVACANAAFLNCPAVPT